MEPEAAKLIGAGLATIALAGVGVFGVLAVLPAFRLILVFGLISDLDPRAR